MYEKYWVALSSIEELDSEFIVGIYNYFGDIKSVFEKSLNGFRESVSGDYKSVKKVDLLINKRDKIEIDKLYNSVLERGLKIMTYEDDDYPYLLKQITDPPAVLYYKGDFADCNLKRTLAVVGSRRITRSAIDSLKKIISGLANTDLCIVSGLALGADTVAHRSALDNGLSTIGVIGGGFDNLYPNSNRGMVEEIINGRGVVMSECYPTFEPLPFRFPQRNRIVSGLSYGTLVAEAAIKSGALITANLTLEQGRELMCIPGAITNPNTAGIYKMIKTGASIIVDSDDVLESLEWTVNKQISLFGDETPLDLSEEELKVIDSVSIEPKTFDEIVKTTNIDSDKLFVILTNLELQSLIKQTSGDRYIKI